MIKSIAIVIVALAAVVLVEAKYKASKVSTAAADTQAVVHGMTQQSEACHH